jgi:hypothetical protein
LNGIVEEITDTYNSYKKKDPVAAYMSTVERYGERIMKYWTYPALPAVPRLLEACIVTRSEGRSSDYGPPSTASDVAREIVPVPPRSKFYDPNSRKRDPRGSFKTPMRGSKMAINMKITSSKKVFKKTLKTLNRKEPDAFDSVNEDTHSTPKVVSDDESDDECDDESNKIQGTDKEKPQASTSVRQEKHITLTDQDLPANFSLGSLPLVMPDDVLHDVEHGDIDKTIFVLEGTEEYNSLVDANTGVVVNAKNLHQKNPLFRTSNSIVEVEVPIQCHAIQGTGKEEPQASTSTRPQQAQQNVNHITITDLKMFFIDQLKEMKTEMKEHQEKCLAKIFEKSKESPEVCKGQRRYSQSIARKALDIVNQLGPRLIQHISLKEETVQNEGDNFRALCQHVNAKLQINQSGRLIEVLFNCSQFLEAAALVFKDPVDELMASTHKLNGINVYRYVLQRLFTHQQLAYMCFGGNIKTYVKIFHAYLNAFQ